MFIENIHFFWNVYFVLGINQFFDIQNSKCYANFQKDELKIDFSVVRKHVRTLTRRLCTKNAEIVAPPRVKKLDSLTNRFLALPLPTL